MVTPNLNLEELLQFLNGSNIVTESQLERTLKQSDLQVLSKPPYLVRHWEHYAGYPGLGLDRRGKTECCKIYSKNKNFNHLAVEAALRVWWKKFQRPPTFRALLNILMALHEGYTALQVCKYAGMEAVTSGTPSKSSAPGPHLDHKDLKIICRELYEVRARWRPIGSELDITPGTLDAIEQEYSKPEDRLYRVLQDWLNKGLASWRQLVQALWSKQVGDRKLARELEEKFCQTVLITSEVTGTELGTKRALDDDTEQLHNDIRSIERKFSKLLTSTRKSIKNRKVPSDELVAFLSPYKSSRAVRKGEDRTLADRQDDLEREENVNKIFTIISPFLSFLDFGILEDMINDKEVGADSDRENLADYIVSLKQFLNSWKVEPRKIIRDENELIGSRVKLCFKLETESLSMYRNVKANIAQILEVPVSALQLCSIEEGCIELVFLITREAISKFLPLESLRSSLSDLRPRILKLTLIDGERTESVDMRADTESGQSYQVSTSDPSQEMEVSAYKSGKDTPEYRAILASFGKLVNEVFPRDIDRIISAIQTTKIIADTRENRSKIMTGSNHDRSRNLGYLLIDSVEISSGNFHKLIEVLHLVGPWTENTVKFMTDECKK